MQGIDYSYTIQGWLKGINHSKTISDPGKDNGFTDQSSVFHFSNFAKDAYSQVLNYFTGDFVSTNNIFNASNRLNTTVSSSDFKNLYNGNIASWETKYLMRDPLHNKQNIDNTFRYDLLNRLRSSKSWEYSDVSNTWTANDVYNTSYNYDQNGNIMQLKRWGMVGATPTPMQIDNLTYNYGTTPVSNRLNLVNESISTPANSPDLSLGLHPYTYDNAGNLTSDLIDSVSNVIWTVDGKVKNIYKTLSALGVSSGTITYLYDASGNRVSKRNRIRTYSYVAAINAWSPVFKDNLTLYARDANEQVMAIYERDTIMNVYEEQSSSAYQANLKITSTEINSACEYVLDLDFNQSSSYTIDEDGSIILLNNFSVECKNNLGTYITIPAGSKIFRNYFDALQTQKTGLRVPIGENYMKDTNSYSIKIEGLYGIHPAIVSTYVYSGSTDFKRPKLSEWHIYGNEQQGRFVTRKPENTLYYLDNISNDVLAKNFFRTMDKKQYELKDHLGNVRATIGDYKMPANDATSTRGVAPFFVDEKAVNDYYPYGMLISDRSFNSGSSRYGYNGKEKDNEVVGEGNHIDFGDRGFDTRRGQWWSVDVKAGKYPSISPYVFCLNNPIVFIDPDGKDVILFDQKGNKVATITKAGTVIEKGMENSAILKSYIATKEYFKGTSAEVDFTEFENDSKILNIKQSSDPKMTAIFSDSGYEISADDLNGNKKLDVEEYSTLKGIYKNAEEYGSITWNPFNGAIDGDDNKHSPAMIFEHEIKHAKHFKDNLIKFNNDINTKIKGFKKVEEKNAINETNKVSKEKNNGDGGNGTSKKRTTHNLKEVYPTKSTTSNQKKESPIIKE